MDCDSFFSKLRRVATTVQNETALAKERMSRPTAVRSSGDSARPVLRRMQSDAHNLKWESSQQLATIQNSGDYDALLTSCKQLCDVYQSNVTELENYLQQYGYHPKPVNMKAPAMSQDSAKKPTSTKLEEASSTHGSSCDVHATSSETAEENKENFPATPPNEELQSSLKESRGGTPRLEDFGLSRQAMELLSRNRLHGHQPQRPDSSIGGGEPLNSTYSKGEMFNARTPMRASSQLGNCPFTPLGITTTPAGVTVTPGIFGGSDLPTVTPTQFIDVANARPDFFERSAAPHTKSGVSKSLHFPVSSENTGVEMSAPLSSSLSQNHQMPGTPSAPELTARWHFTAVAPPQPPPKSDINQVEPGRPGQEKMPAFNPLGADTPPTPELTTRWNPVAVSVMPEAPERLTKKMESNVLLEEPVRLAKSIPSHTPEEPPRLVNNHVGPSQDPPATPPSVSGFLGRSKGFDASRFLSDDMPKTPELTMSYARYVDPLQGSKHIQPEELNTKDQAAPAQMQTHPAGGPGSHIPTDEIHTSHPILSNRSNSGGQSAGCNSARSPSIATITEDEFQNQSDYMRRILPLDLINTTLDKINAILQDKYQQGEGLYLTDDDVQRIGLGTKAKAMLLLFTKLQRVSISKRPGSNNAIYYPL